MKKHLKFNYNPFKNGLNQVLGTLEKDIMEIIWRRGESSVKEILHNFPPERDISYSTVITVTNRMENKGFLLKRKAGKAYLYTPSCDKEEFLEMVSKKVIDGISGFSFQSAVTHFLDYVNRLDPEKIEYFARLIESKKKKDLQK